MISEWGMNPPSPTGWLKNTRWFISHYDFEMGCDPPPFPKRVVINTRWLISPLLLMCEKCPPPPYHNNPNNNNWDNSMTCRPSAAGKKGRIESCREGKIFSSIFSAVANIFLHELISPHILTIEIITVSPPQVFLSPFNPFLPLKKTYKHNERKLSKLRNSLKEDFVTKLFINFFSDEYLVYFSTDRKLNSAEEIA